MRKKKAISKEDFAKEYYTKHKSIIDSVFGNEKDFYNAVDKSVREVRFYSKKSANAAIKDLLVMHQGGDSKLIRAKRTADNKGLYFPDGRALNKRIKPFSSKSSSAAWTDPFGYDVEVKEYYEISNSDLVLANIIVSEPGGKSPRESWRFIDKDLV